MIKLPVFKKRNVDIYAANLCQLEPGIDITNTKTCSIIGIRIATSQRINAVHYSRGVYLSVYLYLIIKLFVCVKDRTCLRTAIPAYYFNIFGSIFSALLFLLTKKLIFGIKNHLTEYEKVSMCSLKCEGISSYEQRRNIFSRKLHIGMV